ncbi:MAG: M15 family peptidase [Candidatus Thorarchaeota archaeon]|jgi:peptidoglycan L-alanyl-D-glutamate endopeptidase CwlK
MAEFGQKSLKRLETLDRKLVDVLTLAIRIMDFSVLSTHRTMHEQEELYENGFSRKKFPNSKHNTYPSKAVDIAPYPIDWSEDDRFYVLAGVIRACAHKYGVKLRWGGDWDGDDDLHDQTFMDLGHYELID